MTRELKLALIVGFALVLGVTVLISDHLSAARKSDLAANTPENPPIAVQPISEPSYDPLNPGTVTDSGRGYLPTSPILPEPTRSAMSNVTQPDPAINDNAVPTLVQGPEGGMRNPVVGTDPDQGIKEVILRNGGGMLDGTFTLPPAASLQTPSGSVQSKPIDPTLESLLRQQNTIAKLEQANNPTSNSDAAMRSGNVSIDPVPVMIDPKILAEENWHVVQDGESAFKVAKRYYGDGKYWKKLAELNGNRIGKEGQVRTGVKLKLPSVQEVTGRAGSLMATPNTATKTASKTGSPKTVPAKLVEPAPASQRETAAAVSGSYTVKSGDTLAEISQRELGTVKRVKEILALNKITDANRIKVGMVLKMPKR